MSDTRSSPLAAPLGAIATMAVAAALTPLRDTAFGHTNAALVLVVIVACSASLGGRWAGVLSATTAALSFNFFLTEPIHSLHIDDATDITTVVLLAAVGLVIGEFARQRGIRADALAEVAAGDLERAQRLERVAGYLASDLTHEQLCAAVAEEVRDELGLASARWEPYGVTSDRPMMERSGWVPVDHHRHTAEGFEFPPGGVDVGVSYAGARLGTLVLIPHPGVGVSSKQRKVALALADLLASALARGRGMG
jgi:K+-sensing histidine kinase KdpD